MPATIAATPKPSPTFKPTPLYKRDSPGLLGPLVAGGFCLGPEVERLHLDVQSWCDFDAPIYSGDTVAVFVVRPDHSIRVLGKKIERTRDGWTWVYAWATRDANSMFAMPVDGELLRILAIAPIVAELETPRETLREPVSDAEGRKVLQALGHIGAAAVEEWRTQGFMPRTQLGIINDPRSVAMLKRADFAR